MEENFPKIKNIFPKDFMWGASTAAHQVEGGNVNQWSAWELAHASELAKDAHHRYGHLENWHEIKKQAEDPNNYVSGVAVKHYELYEQDFDLVNELNLDSFRFGIEWSRIEPEEGVWDEGEIEHYHRYIAALKKRGIEPVLNVWHWTMPTWFTDRGGFTHHSNIKFFDRFVKKIADEYSHDLKYVITLNEPNVYATFGYLVGIHPPTEKKPLKFTWVYWNLIVAHKHSYKILKRANPKIRIGVAAQLANIQAKRPHNLIDETATKIMRYLWNWWFLIRTRKYQDFIGLNYYYTDYYKGLLVRENPELPKSDIGWYMEPEGVYPLLLRVWSRYKKPIIITENGVADSHDEYRRWWVEETIIAMERAMSEGVVIKGYFHWSLLDNFEWRDGWWPKFGLVEVDREHGMKRTIRPSSNWFGEKVLEIKNRGRGHESID